MWGAAEADAVEGEPVWVDVPTLILTGEFDPVTPQDFASGTAGYLDKAQSFVIPGYTHDVVSSSTCALEIMKQFLDAPEKTPDTSCLDELKLRFNWGVVREPGDFLFSQWWRICEPSRWQTQANWP
jgi:hypothetical protein